MLESYVDKAGLVDGMELLDLGCGWGSLSLFLAEVYSQSLVCFDVCVCVLTMEKFPGSKVSSLSNSHSQKAFIDDQAQKRGLQNLTVVTGDVKDYEFPENRYPTHFRTTPEVNEIKV